MEVFFENVEKTMKAQGLTRSALARHLDVPRATVQSWFARKARVPLDTASRIADVLGTTVGALLGETVDHPLVNTMGQALDIIDALEGTGVFTRFVCEVRGIDGMEHPVLDIRTEAPALLQHFLFVKRLENVRADLGEKMFAQIVYTHRESIADIPIDSNETYEIPDA